MVKFELTGGQMATLISRGHSYDAVTRAIVLLSMLTMDQAKQTATSTMDGALTHVLDDIDSFEAY